MVELPGDSLVAAFIGTKQPDEVSPHVCYLLLHDTHKTNLKTDETLSYTTTKWQCFVISLKGGTFFFWMFFKLLCVIHVSHLSHIYDPTVFYYYLMLLNMSVKLEALILFLLILFIHYY